MRCTRTDTGAFPILQIEGALDAGTAHDLVPTFTSLAAGTSPFIVVDLSALRLIDGAGAAVLVSFYKQVRARGGDVHAIGLQHQPRAIFQLLRLDRHLCAYAPRQLAAIAA